MNVFSELKWIDDSNYWSGTVLFNGVTLTTVIDFDVNDPSESDRGHARDAATALLESLTSEWEQRCRRDAASEITESTYSHSDQPVTDTLVSELLTDLKLMGLEFTFCPNESWVMGTLAYESPKCFPDMNIQINFNADLTVDEVMVIE